MKNKMFLPLLAVLFAIAGAFASAPLTQTAWFDSNGLTAGGGQQGQISIPSNKNCTTDPASHVCKIVVADIQFNAYDSQTNAEAGGGMGSVGLLRYN